MTAKKYLWTILMSLVLFIIFHLLTWNFLTKFVFDNQNSSIGDLGRMSYLKKSLMPRVEEQNLLNKHIPYKANKKVDVLTIGDSFSNGGGAGENGYYQDFIATEQNLTVMNIQPFPQGYIETVLILEKSGFLDRIKPKIIILQSVERFSIKRFSKNILWEISLNQKKVEMLLEKKYNLEMPHPFFINNLNFNALLYNILYHYNNHAFFSKTYIEELNQDFFSVEESRKLLFYYKDLKNIPLASKKNLTLLNNNLNFLQKILDKKNIQLYFMPSVDKYNLYSPYIIKKHISSLFFERLREFPKEYNFIDTKSILQKLTDRELIDVYYADDSHWSAKASKEIFTQIKLKGKNQ